MSTIMFYHGTTKSSAAPFAHPDTHTFWVYPGYLPTRNKWDTHTSASGYCNNHVAEGPPPQDMRLQQYVCLGHTSKDDMSVAHAEWLKMGLPVHTHLDSNQLKAVSGEYPRLSAMFGSLIERIEALEAKVEALESKLKEYDEMVERVDAKDDDTVVDESEEDTVKDVLEDILEEAFKESKEEVKEVEEVKENKIYEVEEVSCKEIYYPLSAVAILFMAVLVYHLLLTSVRSDVILSSREIDL